MINQLNHAQNSTRIVHQFTGSAFQSNKCTLDQRKGCAGFAWRYGVLGGVSSQRTAWSFSPDLQAAQSCSGAGGGGLCHDTTLLPQGLFRPRATKSGWPYGVMCVSSLALCRTPHPHPDPGSLRTLTWHGLYADEVCLLSVTILDACLSSSASLQVCLNFQMFCTGL